MGNSYRRMMKLQRIERSRKRKAHMGYERRWETERDKHRQPNM